MLTDGPIREQLTNGVLPDQHRPLAPSRLSGDTRLSDAETGSTGPQGKRQPRKLTKSRGNSEVGVPTADSIVKSKSVLQKKKRGSIFDGESTPSGAAKPDDGRRSHSFASMSSGSKET